MSAVLAAIVIVLSAAGAYAGPSVSVAPSFPANTTVGQSGVADLIVVNTSANDAGEIGFDTNSFQLDVLTLVPSCGFSFAVPDCPVGAKDPGVITPNPLTATGMAGTACEGITFTVTLNDATQGKYFLSPDATVVLGPSAGSAAAATCGVNLTFDVPKTPTIDSNPGSPGLQTAQNAFAAVTNITPGANFGTTGGGVGTSQVTVSTATPAISNTASADITLGSGTLTDTATVTGLVNPVTGGGAGTVEFRLYGPDDATCATAIFTSPNRPLTLNGAQTIGTATSASFPPVAAGTYRWRAFYSGDVNNAPVNSACNAPQSTSVVSPPASGVDPPEQVDTPAKAKCNGVDVTIPGTSGDDVLVGTPGNDVIASGDGEDIVRGGGGNDIICGGGDADTIRGGQGNDSLFGEADSDTLNGGRGTDRCSGGTAFDRAKKCEKVGSI